jgi:hypothetical protein
MRLSSSATLPIPALADDVTQRTPLLRLRGGCRRRGRSWGLRARGGCRHAVVLLHPAHDSLGGIFLRLDHRAAVGVAPGIVLKGVMSTQPRRHRVAESASLIPSVRVHPLGHFLFGHRPKRRSTCACRSDVLGARSSGHLGPRHQRGTTCACRGKGVQLCLGLGLSGGSADTRRAVLPDEARLLRSGAVTRRCRRAGWETLPLRRPSAGSSVARPHRACR